MLKNQKFDVEISSSGHMLLNLLGAQTECCTFLTQDKVPLNEKNLFKLHKQFGHCSCPKLLQLLKNAYSDLEVNEVNNSLEKLVDKCDICLRYGRSALKPVAALPLSTEFNGCVAMDLHELTILGRNIWYFHIIDVFSRFSAAGIVRTKKKEPVFACFARIWLSIFGPPAMMLSDNGGEFLNDVFSSFGDQYDVHIKTTAAYSPWSNGTVERHNAILTEVFYKTIEERKCSPETAICYAVFAKNSMHNNSGYSPYQIVFGKNPVIPTVLNNQPPALCGRSFEDLVTKHLSTLHESRKNYVKAESSNRIRCALRSNIRPHNGPFKTGDLVYFQRDPGFWRGPATVVGQDGKQVFVRYTGNIVNVHPCKLRFKNEETGQEDQTSENSPPEGVVTVEPEPETTVREVQSESDEEIETASPDYVNLDDDGTAVLNELKPQVPVNVSRPSPQKMPLFKSVKFLPKDETSDQWFTAKILSRAGKATGKHRNCYNIEYTSPNDWKGKRNSVDFKSEVEEYAILNSDLDDTDDDRGADSALITDWNI